MPVVMGRLRLWVAREIAGAVRARWFALYATVFLAGGLLLAILGASGSSIAGYRGFARGFAGLIHVTLLFVPLMALIPATATIVEDRESGVLEYFLAQPVTFGEVYLGKWAGMSIAILLALSIGFAIAGGVAVLRGVPVAWVLALYAFVALLTLAFVALGLCYSTIAGTRARATTAGIVTWLVLVTIGSLGLIVAFVRLGTPPAVLIGWTFANPVEAFRMAVLATLDPDLTLLGPVGVTILERFGAAGTKAMAVASLACWILAPGTVGWWWFRRAR